jgi:hypothetical protein
MCAFSVCVEVWLGQDNRESVRAVLLQDNRSVQRLITGAVLSNSYGRGETIQTQLFFCGVIKKGTKISQHHIGLEGGITL